MIDCAAFYNSLVNRGVQYFTGVPDSLLSEFCEYVDQKSSKENHVIAVNEGAAVSLAIGHHLKSISPALVYLQNSGVGNAINPLMSLADEAVYSIPMLLLVGWRGEPGVADEPQHVKQGAVSEELFRALGIDYCVLDADSDFEAILDECFSSIAENSRPHAILVRKQTFSKVERVKRSNDHALSREESIKLIVDKSSTSDALVSTTGKASRELFEARQSKIVSDVIDYHASTDSLIELGEKSNVDMVAFYHLVPVPLNSVLEDVFKRGVPDNFLLAEDLMWFELPIGSDDIVVNRP